MLLLPDSPLLLALALLLFWLSRHPAVIPSTAGEAIGLGLILGLVTLGTYHAFLVLLSLLGWSLGSRDRRALVRRPWPALGRLVWLIVSAPLWLWNVQNGWVSFLFHGGRTDAVAGYALAAPPLFLLSQVALLFPTLGIVLLLALLPAPTGTGPPAPGSCCAGWCCRSCSCSPPSRAGCTCWRAGWCPPGGCSCPWPPIGWPV